MCIIVFPFRLPTTLLPSPPPPPSRSNFFGGALFSTFIRNKEETIYVALQTFRAQNDTDENDLGANGAIVDSMERWALIAVECWVSKITEIYRNSSAHNRHIIDSNSIICFGALLFDSAACSHRHCCHCFQLHNQRAVRCWGYKMKERISM